MVTPSHFELMPARIFISCGQRPGAEENFCVSLKAWLLAQGYEAYIAIKIQSILDLNREIVEGIKNSDYYVFINFARETVRDGSGNEWNRGSVYTNQELALALGDGIEHCLFINQGSARKEGIHNYLVSNIPEFKEIGDLLPIVQKAIQEAGWSPKYSRHLTLGALRWSLPVPYCDHTTGNVPRLVNVLHASVKNQRVSGAAFGVVVRLTSFGHVNAAAAPSPDQALLKATGSHSYQHVIFPGSEASFDLLSLAVGVPNSAYLHSLQDLAPRPALVSVPGVFRFHYELAAERFPPLKFSLEINICDGALDQAIPRPVVT